MKDCLPHLRSIRTSACAIITRAGTDRSRHNLNRKSEIIDTSCHTLSLSIQTYHHQIGTRCEEHNDREEPHRDNELNERVSLLFQFVLLHVVVLSVICPDALTEI